MCYHRLLDHYFPVTQHQIDLQTEPKCQLCNAFITAENLYKRKGDFLSNVCSSCHCFIRTRSTHDFNELMRASAQTSSDVLQPTAQKSELAEAIRKVCLIGRRKRYLNLLQITENLDEMRSNIAMFCVKPVVASSEMMNRWPTVA